MEHWLRQLAVGISLVCSLAACRAFSQVDTLHSGLTQQAEDQSFYLGKPVLHPEELSGVWEAPDARGGAIGIHLVLYTTAPVETTTLVGTEQDWHALQVGIYQRAGAVLSFGEENSFSDSPRGGSVRYEEGRLTLHYPRFDLDLLRIPRDRWSGRIHRERFDSQVTLMRPGLRTGAGGAWLVGTWSTTNGPMQLCLHIAEQAPGEFTGWLDSLLTWGSVQSAPHVAKPPFSWERYGELVKVQAAANSDALIE
ncbi:MAG TPA: hypothetical protein VGM27_31245, partial [Acidobacteriaceae bacterium]